MFFRIIILLLFAFNTSHLHSICVGPSLQAIYTAEIGVREATGKNDGLRVETYQRSAGGKKGQAYCSAFVRWCLNEAGIKSTVNMWSPTAHNSKNVVYQNSKFLKDWRIGDVFTLYYPKLKRIGHTGFVDDVKGQVVETVEANTNMAGSREGDGVYRKYRPLKSLYTISRWE